MKRQLLYATTAALLFSACSEPLQEAVEINNEAQSTDAKTIELSPEEMSLIERIANKSPKVSPETAQETALHLLGMQNQPASLSKKMKTAVFCNKKSIYNKLSKSYKLEDDTAFYVFNTTDNQGFAIVAADLRVPNQIIAYSDNGSFDTETDNPGLALFLDLAKGYVADCIATADAQEDSLTESINRKLGIKQDTTTKARLRTKYYFEKYKVGVKNYKITIKPNGEIKPLLKSHWGQGYPYNTQCGGKEAGCGAIAIAQILTYWHYPDYAYNLKISWQTIENEIDKSYGFSENYINNVSTLVLMAREGIKTNKDGGAKDHNVLQYLRRINCSSQQQMYDYKYYKVKDALDYKMPVLMGGYRDKTNGKGHYWIADGYIDRYVTKNETITYLYIIHNDNGSVEQRLEESPISVTNHYELLHINWGWNKKGDGYYNSGVFNTDRQMIESYDGYFNTTPSEGLSNVYYDTELEIITDIKPR